VAHRWVPPAQGLIPPAALVRCFFLPNLMTGPRPGPFLSLVAQADAPAEIPAQSQSMSMPRTASTCIGGAMGTCGMCISMRLLRECHRWSKNAPDMGMDRGAAAVRTGLGLRPNFARSRKLPDSQGLVWIVPNNRRKPVRRAPRPGGPAHALGSAAAARLGGAAPTIPRGDSKIWIVRGRVRPAVRAASRRRCRKRFLRH
jgi:hypothetical protein